MIQEEKFTVRRKARCETKPPGGLQASFIRYHQSRSDVFFARSSAVSREKQEKVYFEVNVTHYLEHLNWTY